MVRLNKTQRMQPGIYTEQFPGAQSSLVTMVRSCVTGGNQISLEEVKGEWFIFSYFDSEKTKESE